MTTPLRPLCVAGLLIALGAGCISASEAQGQGDVAARVGDAVVTLADVEDAWNADDPRGRLRLLQDLYEARRRALDALVGDRLIDREAEARGVGRDALLAAELPARTEPVTDAEIDRIYERNRDRLGGRTLEEVRPEIRAAIEQQRPAQALRRYRSDLRLAAGDVVVTLDPPRQQIETFPGDRSKGPAGAPIVIVEFSDFECPYCKQATDTLAELIERYPDRIRFVYKDFPLPNHPNAFKAAEAGHCAHDQGKFWELHDRLFAAQDALDVESLKRHADALGLDAGAFAACLDDGRHAASVERELSAGRRAGASSTPTLFVNGRPVFGALPLEFFDRIIQEELAAAARR